VRDGQITLINNDHTILGLRTSVSLAPYLPESHRLLPLLQSVWYIPAGLDIWNQLLGKYPGRYATMKGMNVPPPSYGPAMWNQDQPPITEGHRRAAAHGRDGERRCAASYGLFLGWRPTRRSARACAITRLPGLIDLQDTVVGRKAATRATRRSGRARDGSRRLHRVGASAGRLLHRRTGHGGRPSLLLDLRRGVRDGDQRIPRRRKSLRRRTRRR
jgi:hypothetical protein